MLTTDRVDDKQLQAGDDSRDDAIATGEATARRGSRAAAQAGLDVLLTDATVGGMRRFVAPGAAGKLAAGLGRRPDRVGRRLGRLGAELWRVASGGSEARPAKGDRRFADPAWESSWLLRRVMQSYLAVGATVDGLVADAELDQRSDQQARFVVGNVIDALAPTNFPWSNPSVLKETVDRGGANLVAGSRRLARDVSQRRLPAMVDTSKFELGENLALSPGSVVLRTEVFELIRYAPQTETVRERPLLFVPPTINKFYILDLAPGRSVVEHLVAQGQQVFMISWRNPEAAHGHFDLDTYAGAVDEAIATVAELTGQESVHVNGVCSGGIITAGLLGHLAARGELDRIATLTLFVSALDSEGAGKAAALTTREVAAAAAAESARRGYLDGEALAGVFAWLRPNDLVWSYFVNNYLLGRQPPAFDILYWNQDGVRLAAGLHRDFLKLSLENSFASAGALEVLDSPVDLGAVNVETYVVAGLNDHIVPWQSALRGAQLLGGKRRFVLSTSGHIQALINPPAPDSRSSYRLCDDLGDDSEAVLQTAPPVPGSWWPDYIAWLAERSGELRTAPKAGELRKHRALAKAPGTYVRAC